MSNKQLRIYDISGKFIRVSVDEAIARGFNHWKGWLCAAGVRSLYIDYDGNILICNTASSSINIYNKNNVIKKLKVGEHKGLIGNIYDGWFPLKQWNICEFKTCSCGADIIVSKTNRCKNLLAVTKDGYYGQDRTNKNLKKSIGNHCAVEMNFPIPYQILWDLTRRCNYNCSYCWPGIHNKVEKFIPIDLILESCNNFINCTQGNKIRWNFGGGEPTTHPGFIDIISYLKSRNQNILVTSNVSKRLSFWKEACKYINNINLSAHFEYMNKQHFIHVLQIFMDRHDSISDENWIEVKLMTPPGKLNEALKFKDKIEKLDRLHKPGADGRIKGVCSLVPIRSLADPSKLTNYKDNEIEYFKNQ